MAESWSRSGQQKPENQHFYPSIFLFPTKQRILRKVKSNLACPYRLFSATDKEGDTCLVLAQIFRDTEIVHYLENLPKVDVKGTNKLCNTALEAAPEQCNAMKEEIKALQEMLKSVMDQQKEMLEAQKGVQGPTQHTAPVSEQPQQGGMAELRAVCAEMRETVRQCSEHNTKLAEKSKRLAEEIESLDKTQRKDEGKGL